MIKSNVIGVTKKDKVAHVEILRPNKRNALSVEVIEGLYETANALRRDGDVVAVVLSGRGDYFSAGADIKDPRIFSPDAPTYERLYYGELGAEVVKAWECLPQITFAAIESFAVGGGLSFAIACDFRVMGESAYVYVPEVRLGANYGWNSIPRLVSLIGPSRTKRLVLMDEKIGALDAKDWGLIDYIAADGSCVFEALKLAEVVATKPRLPVHVTKSSVNGLSTVFNQISSHGDMLQAIACMDGERPLNKN